MVILAGSGHLIYRHGIPSRIDRMLDLKGVQRSLVVLSHFDKKYKSAEADISLPTKTIKLAPAGVFGISMKDTKEGIQLSKIIKDGVAETAGMRVGDFLIKLDKIKVNTIEAFNLWRLNKKPGDKVDVIIRRNGRLLTKTLILGG